MKNYWQTNQRRFEYKSRPIVMAILNVTPDSFSDGGRFEAHDHALRQVERYLEEGADIIDVGGESTRPNSKKIEVEEEIRRVVPIIEKIKKRFDNAISIDTSKSEVAERAVKAGAEIINDISGLRFDERIAKVSAQYETGLILMHLHGKFDTMHERTPLSNIVRDVADGFNWSIEIAEKFSITEEQICLDVGIGFSKTYSQNLELIAKLQTLCDEFEKYPMLIGVSRKSFIGKTLDDASVDERLSGTIAANIVSYMNGANIVRVHDVKPAVEALKVARAIKNSR